MDYKRITLFAGHYGSGKTNIAVNFAIKLKSVFENVKIADIDIVNPYFRTKDSEEILKENGAVFHCPPESFGSIWTAKEALFGAFSPGFTVCLLWGF